MRHVLAAFAPFLLAALPVSGQSLFELGGPAPDIGGAAAVDIDFALLRSAPTRLVLSTPDGRAVVAERAYFEDRAAAGVLWRGRIAGVAYDNVTLTAANGFLFGSFSDAAGRRYLLETNAAGAQTVTAVARPAKSGPRRCGVDSAFLDRRRSLHAPPRRLDRQLADRQARSLVEQAPGTAEIDIMIVYTAKAATMKGGDKPMRAFVQSAVDYLNTSLSSSRVDARVRLVHAAEAPADVTTHLGPVTPSRDELFQFEKHQTVAEWRTRYGADVVHLFLDGNDDLFWCGVAEAWEKDDTEKSMVAKAFAITVVGLCPGEELEIFAHEVGHNFGGMHDPDTIREEGGFPDPLAFKPYAYGFNNKTHKTHTLMSYGFGPPEDRSTVVPYFSNVDVTRNGQAVGEKGVSEAARVFRETTPQMARLLGPQAPQAPTGLTGRATGADSVMLTWTDNSNDETGFEVTHMNGLGQIVKPTMTRKAATVDANAVQVQITGLATTGYHTFEVRARNGNGLSAPSNAVSFQLSGRCQETGEEACLQGGRFAASVRFTDPQGERNARRSTADLGPNSAVFYFFDKNNAEMLLKVLDGCAINRNYWVYGAAATDLEYRIFVRDSGTGRVFGYYNTPSTRSPAVTNIKAFDTCGR